MNEGIKKKDLIIFPSSLSMRRYEQKLALKNGFCEKTNFTTFNIFKNKILNSSLKTFKFMSSTKKLLFLHKAIKLVFSNSSKQHNLIFPSINSYYHILLEIEKELSNLPYISKDILKWMIEFPISHRLHYIGLLYKTWNEECKKANYFDNVECNKLILSILRNDKNYWPIFLRDYESITFRDLRWLNPFEEQCVIYLSKQIHVNIESSLPLSHAFDRSDNLGQKVISEIQTSVWPIWTEDLTDAWILDNSEIINDIDLTNFDFSQSADAYGEIEDLVRRIIWYIEKNDCQYHDIAIVVPNMSLVDDIIPHVFKRFNLPYYFRRGRPASSSPLVKSFISYLSFPLNRKRDALIDLIRNPNLIFDNENELMDTYLVKQKYINCDEIDYFKNMDNLTAKDVLSILDKRVLLPDSGQDHFNFSSVQELRKILLDFNDSTFSLNEIIEIIVESLSNINISPAKNNDHGINIINIDDAVGLEYRLVCFAAQNDGLYPSTQLKNKLLNNNDRHNLKLEIEKSNKKLPVMALADSNILLEQESIKFISSLGISSDQIVFSYRATDIDGEELFPSMFYKQLWNLIGWGKNENLNLSPYNKWRIKTSKNNYFKDFYNKQKNIFSYDRKPMPGESFLIFIPKEFCHNDDELINAEILEKNIYELSNNNEYDNLFEKILTQRERDYYLKSENKIASIYNGHLKKKELIKEINNWINNQDSFSPSSLEDLSHNRYVFLLKRVFNFETVDMAEDLTNKKLVGILIHDILKNIYSDLKNDKNQLNLSNMWANFEGDTWKKSSIKKNNKSIKLLVLDSSKLEQILNFALNKSNEIIDKTINAFSEHKKALLGSTSSWLIEREKIISSVLRIVELDVICAKKRNSYPIAFELKFGPKKSTSLTLEDIPIKGCIDRIDLCFDRKNNLSEIHVIDYKSRKNNTFETNIERIKKAMDCQLVIYAFAAQNFLFGRFNNKDLNEKTKISFMEYEGINFFDRKLKDYYKDGTELILPSYFKLIPLSYPNMINEFLENLLENFRYIKMGNFSIYPYYQKFDAHEQLLRIKANPEIIKKIARSK